MKQSHHVQARSLSKPPCPPHGTGADYSNARTAYYHTEFVHATIAPDGYDQEADFYLDDFGQPQWCGPLRTKSTIYRYNSK